MRCSTWKATESVGANDLSLSRSRERVAEPQARSGEGSRLRRRKAPPSDGLARSHDPPAAHMPVSQIADAIRVAVTYSHDTHR